MGRRRYRYDDRRNRYDDDRVEDVYGQSAGAIGGLIIVLGILYAIKDRTGLPWPAAVLLTVGVLVGLGYLAWRIKTEVVRRWARQPAEVSSEVLAQESPAGGDVPHPELTRALVRTGAIGKDDVIPLHDVDTRVLDVGTQYTFLLPEGGTHEDVAKRLGPIGSMLGVTRLHLKLETSRHTEREVRLLVLKEPPFSRLFAPPSREQIRAFEGIPLGHDVTGALSGVETFDGASMLIAGMSQMGKTTLLNGLITCLCVAYGDDFDMILLDGKFIGLARFAKIALRYESSTEPAVLENMLDDLISEVDNRYAEIEKAIRARQQKPRFRRLFFIVDEAADFYASNGSKESRELVSRVEDKSRYVVAKALESGVSVIFLTQRPDKDAIPVNVRAQFQYRACLYVDSEGAAKVTLGDSYFTTMAPINPVLLNPKHKGQAVLFVHGASTHIRGFNFPDDFIWDVIDEAHDRRQKHLSAAPDTPLKKAIDVLRDKGVEFMATADLAPALGITEPRAGERGKQLSKLLGVSPGKDESGVVRGYWLSDLTTAFRAGS
ncbi:FtsK/SpoIIIE domain-containing protein [Streptomyces luteireticuli]|uniref:FtsK/SpoIIIE domain-containing protein n=1 Tax=Streptomyces luteireticuli TaxID=173858 RepID=UPI003555D6B8